METLDRCFENVCELDLIFHVDRVHNILQEICMGGMVLETNMAEILCHVDAQNKLEKSEASATATLRVRGVRVLINEIATCECSVPVCNSIAPTHANSTLLPPSLPSTHPSSTSNMFPRRLIRPCLLSRTFRRPTSNCLLNYPLCQSSSTLWNCVCL